MSEYHFSQTQHQRSKGHNAIAGAAYRAGEKLIEESGAIHDYTKKSEVVHSEIAAPEHAPAWVFDADELFKSVETCETRKDATVGMEQEVSLPLELSREQNIACVRDYIQRTQEVFAGAIFHYGYHDKKGNPHAHIWHSDRAINENGTWSEKDKMWTQKKALHSCRKLWADCVNAALEKEGYSARVDHRSLKDRGIKREAQIHVGRGYRDKERRLINERIKAENLQNAILDAEKNRLLATAASYEREARYLTLTIEDTENEIKALAHEIEAVEKEIVTSAKATVLEKSSVFASVRSSKPLVHEPIKTAPELAPKPMKVFDFETVAFREKLEREAAEKIRLDAIEREKIVYREMTDTQATIYDSPTGPS